MFYLQKHNKNLTSCATSLVHQLCHLEHCRGLWYQLYSGSELKKIPNNNGLNNMGVHFSLWKESRNRQGRAGEASPCSHQGAVGAFCSTILILNVTWGFKMATEAPALMFMFPAGNRRKQKKKKTSSQPSMLFLNTSKNATHHLLTVLWPERSHRTMVQF